MGDAGLTGRKIIVDTYGGWGAHGGDTSYSLAFFNICNGFGCYILQSSFFTGGAFSGKDYTKVDRSAAYAARWVAKSLVKAGLCKRVLVQVSGCLLCHSPLTFGHFLYFLSVTVLSAGFLCYRCC